MALTKSYPYHISSMTRGPFYDSGSFTNIFKRDKIVLKYVCNQVIIIELDISNTECIPMYKTFRYLTGFSTLAIEVLWVQKCELVDYDRSQKQKYRHHFSQ